jgi:hypothetical protein
MIAIKFEIAKSPNGINQSSLNPPTLKVCQATITSHPRYINKNGQRYNLVSEGSRFKRYAFDIRLELIKDGLWQSCFDDMATFLFFNNSPCLCLMAQIA